MKSLMRPGHRRPRLMDDAERGVAILDAVGDDAERHEVVDLIELDALAPELLVDAVETLQAPVNLLERDLRFAQFRGDGLLEVVDLGFGGFPLAFDLRRERLIAGRIEVLEGQLFELILDLAHAEPVRDRRVDVDASPAPSAAAGLPAYARACACCEDGRRA